MEGLLLIEPAVFRDERGYFMESYNARILAGLGIANTFVQDNQAASGYGVIRGLHYQCGEAEQAKLVRVMHGRVLDVAVDLRTGSPTYGQTYSVELSSENMLQLYIPAGFAHGYAVLSSMAVFFYKCDNYYDPASEGGIHPEDPGLRIDWQIPIDRRIISAKDKGLPHFPHHRPIDV